MNQSVRGNADRLPVVRIVTLSFIVSSIFWLYGGILLQPFQMHVLVIKLQQLHTKFVVDVLIGCREIFVYRILLLCRGFTVSLTCNNMYWG